MHPRWKNSVEKTAVQNTAQRLRRFVNRKTFHLHDELDCLDLHIPDNILDLKNRLSLVCQKPDSSGLTVKDDGDFAPVFPPYPLQHVDQQLLPLGRHLWVLDVPGKLFLAALHPN